MIKKLVTISFFVALISIEYLATTQIEIKPLENSWDKANHLIAFFILFLLLIFSHFELKVSKVILLLLLYAIQIEVVQLFIPNRAFSMLDIFADSIGIFFGFVVYFVFSQRFIWSQYRDKKY